MQTKHPHQESVARIVKSTSAEPKKLMFNYRTTFNSLWDDPKLMQAYGYTVGFPTNPAGSAKVEWRQQ